MVKKGMITEAQLNDALLSQKITPAFIGTILVNKGVIASRQLAEAISEQFELPLVEIKSQYADAELTRKFSSSIILDHKCFPLRSDENTVTVAIINPLNAVAIAKVEEEASPRAVKWLLVTEEDMDEAIKNYRKSISSDIQKLLRKDKKE